MAKSCMKWRLTSIPFYARTAHLVKGSETNTNAPFSEEKTCHNFHGEAFLVTRLSDVCVLRLMSAFRHISPSGQKMYSILRVTNPIKITNSLNGTLIPLRTSTNPMRAERFPLHQTRLGLFDRPHILLGSDSGIRRGNSTHSPVLGLKRAICWSDL